MSLPKISNGIHAGGNIFGDALIPDYPIIFPYHGVSAEQTVEAGSILFLEPRLKILYKSIPIDLLLKYLPVHGICVYSLNGVQGQYLFFTIKSKEVYTGLINLLDPAVFSGDKYHVFGAFEDSTILAF